MNKTFIFVKFDDRSLLYNYKNPWNSDPSIIIDFDDVVKPSFSKFWWWNCFSIFNVFIIGIKGHMSPMSLSIPSLHMFHKFEYYDFKLIISYSSFVCMCCVL